ncbi:hypothetical protein [Gemmatimonas sp.]|uniref:hypothetical protein n=1 Tax=Gemmatimonas sp. TaxID=1962908 RepID=UPI003F6F3F28
MDAFDSAPYEAHELRGGILAPAVSLRAVAHKRVEIGDLSRPAQVLHAPADFPQQDVKFPAIDAEVGYRRDLAGWHLGGNSKCTHHVSIFVVPVLFLC